MSAMWDLMMLLVVVGQCSLSPVFGMQTSRSLPTSTISPKGRNVSFHVALPSSKNSQSRSILPIDSPVERFFGGGSQSVLKNRENRYIAGIFYGIYVEMLLIADIANKLSTFVGAEDVSDKIKEQAKSVYETVVADFDSVDVLAEMSAATKVALEAEQILNTVIKPDDDSLIRDTTSKIENQKSNRRIISKKPEIILFDDGRLKALRATVNRLPKTGVYILLKRELVRCYGMDTEYPPNPHVFSRVYNLPRVHLRQTLPRVHLRQPQSLPMSTPVERFFGGGSQSALIHRENRYIAGIFYGIYVEMLLIADIANKLSTFVGAEDVSDKIKEQAKSVYETVVADFDSVDVLAKLSAATKVALEAEQILNTVIKPDDDSLIRDTTSKIENQKSNRIIISKKPEIILFDDGRLKALRATVNRLPMTGVYILLKHELVRCFSMDTEYPPNPHVFSHAYKLLRVHFRKSQKEAVVRQSLKE